MKIERNALAILLVVSCIGGVILILCRNNQCSVVQWMNARKVQNFEECVIQGYPIMESYPRQCAAGGKTFIESTAEGVIFRSEHIRVIAPAPHESVGAPIVIQGNALTFENTVNYRLRDGDGSILLEGFTTADSPDVGISGTFEITIDSYPSPKENQGMIEVFEYSAMDGTEMNIVRIPITFSSEKTMDVMIYYGNSSLDPDVVSCEKTYPAKRRVADSDSLPLNALKAMIDGPTSQELREKFFTSINDGVSINLLTITEGTAKVDFSPALDENVAGSCRVTAIRSQIESTLKQFVEIEKVIISINGETEVILQP